MIALPSVRGTWGSTMKIRPSPRSFHVRWASANEGARNSIMASPSFCSSEGSATAPHAAPNASRMNMAGRWRFVSSSSVPTRPMVATIQPVAIIFVPSIMNAMPSPRTIPTTT
jgi:hypothetical protein